MAVSGFFLATSNFVVFPLVAKRVPLTRIFKLCSLGAIVLYTIPPFFALLPASLRIPVLMLQAALLQSFQSSMFTAVFMVINNSCTKAQRGRVNGLGMSFSSGFKAAGPAISAVTFAWSLTNDLSEPLDVHLTFYLCGSLGGVTALLAWYFFTVDNDVGVDERTKACAEVPAAASPASVEISSFAPDTPSASPAGVPRRE